MHVVFQAKWCLYAIVKILNLSLNWNKYIDSESQQKPLWSRGNDLFLIPRRLIQHGCLHAVEFMFMQISYDYSILPFYRDKNTQSINLFKSPEFKS